MESQDFAIEKIQNSSLGASARASGDSKLAQAPRGAGPGTEGRAEQEVGYADVLLAREMPGRSFDADRWPSSAATPTPDQHVPRESGKM